MGRDRRARRRRDGESRYLLARNSLVIVVSYYVSPVRGFSHVIDASRPRCGRAGIDVHEIRALVVADAALLRREREVAQSLHRATLSRTSIARPCMCSDFFATPLPGLAAIFELLSGER